MTQSQRGLPDVSESIGISPDRKLSELGFSSRAALVAAMMAKEGVSKAVRDGYVAWSYSPAFYDMARQAASEVQGTGIFGAPSVGPTIERAKELAAQSQRGLPGVSGTEARTVAYVSDAGRGWTEVVYTDGTKEKRVDDRATRNNNPGNIEYGKFAKSLGAVGTDGRFAVFPDALTGARAMEALVFNSPSYSNKTLAEAINKYAPSSENNTQGYVNHVAKSAGVSPNTKLSELGFENRVAVVAAMMAQEGISKAVRDGYVAWSYSPANMNRNPASYDMARQSASEVQGTGIFGALSVGPTIDRAKELAARQASIPASVDVQDDLGSVDTGRLDTSSTRNGAAGLNPTSLARMQQAVQHAGFEYARVNSGYRSPTQNSAAGGARFSQHMSGKAFDIDISKMTEGQKRDLVNAAMQSGMTYAGVYTGGKMVHFDDRETGGAKMFTFDRSVANMARAPEWFRDVAAAEGMQPVGGRVPVPEPRNNPSATGISEVVRADGIPGFDNGAALEATPGTSGLGGVFASPVANAGILANTDPLPMADRAAPFATDDTAGDIPDGFSDYLADPSLPRDMDGKLNSRSSYNSARFGTTFAPDRSIAAALERLSASPASAWADIEPRSVQTNNLMGSVPATFESSVPVAADYHRMAAFRDAVAPKSVQSVPYYSAQAAPRTSVPGDPRVNLPSPSGTLTGSAATVDRFNRMQPSDWRAPNSVPGGRGTINAYPEPVYSNPRDRIDIPNSAYGPGLANDSLPRDAIPQSPAGRPVTNAPVPTRSPAKSVSVSSPNAAGNAKQTANANMSIAAQYASYGAGKLPSSASATLSSAPRGYAALGAPAISPAEAFAIERAKAAVSAPQYAAPKPGAAARPAQPREEVNPRPGVPQPSVHGGGAVSGGGPNLGIGMVDGGLLDAAGRFGNFSWSPATASGGLRGFDPSTGVTAYANPVTGVVTATNIPGVPDVQISSNGIIGPAIGGVFGGLASGLGGLLGGVTQGIGGLFGGMFGGEGKLGDMAAGRSQGIFDSWG